MSEAATVEKPRWFLASSTLGRRVSPATALLLVGYLVVPFMVAALVVDDIDSWAGTGARAAAAGLDGTALAAFAIFTIPLIDTGALTRPLVGVLGVPCLARVVELHSASALVGTVTGTGTVAWGALGWHSVNGIVWSVAFSAIWTARAVGGSWVAARRNRPWVPVACPIGGGWVGVHQGGGRVVNHHWRSPAQRHAVDLLRIRIFGPRFRRPFPLNLDDFFSYGAPVLSPVSGRIVSVVDHVDELGPLLPATGNAIVIEPDGYPGYRLEVGHCRPGSLLVQRGDRVQIGQPVAQVGTSGLSTEPHLHLQVTNPAGIGVPVVFSGWRRPPRRNDVIRPASGRPSSRRRPTGRADRDPSSRTR